MRLENDMTTYDSVPLGLAPTMGTGGLGGVNIFDHRVTSRPAPATVYVERPRRDPLAARLEESLKRAMELQRQDQQRPQVATPAPVV